MDRDASPCWGTAWGWLLLLCLLVPSHGEPSTQREMTKRAAFSQDNELLPEGWFNVEFFSHDPLGIRFDERLHIVSFSRINGKMGQGEIKGWLKPGDSLVAVNGEEIEGLPVMDVVKMIHEADIPKLLTFKAPNSENRTEIMMNLLYGTNRIDGSTGTLEIAKDDRHIHSFPYVKALFGGPTFCKRAPLVVSDPPHGCSVYKNAEEAIDTVVLAHRGTCSFSDKALIAQAQGALALVIVNDFGEAFRMPLTEEEEQDIDLPVVMVGKEILAATDTLWDGPGEVLARLPRDGQYCGSMQYIPEDEDDLENLGDDGNSSSGFIRIQLPETRKNEAERRERVELSKRRAILQATRGDMTSSMAELEADEVDIDANGDLVWTDEIGEKHRLSLDGDTDEDLDNVDEWPYDFQSEFLRGKFGDRYPVNPLRIVIAEPQLACEPLENPDAEIDNALVLVLRGVCPFGEKQRHARLAGAAAMIVVNNELGLIHVPAAAVERSDPDDAALPVLLISLNAGKNLISAVSAADELVKNSEAHQDYPVLGRLVSESDIAYRWEEISLILDATSWHADPKQRRKLYHRLSQVHHPDKETGSDDRFEALSYAYKRANHYWNPDVSFLPQRLVLLSKKVSFICPHSTSCSNSKRSGHLEDRSAIKRQTIL